MQPMIDDKDIELLSYYIAAHENKATAAEVQRHLGYKSVGDVNLHVVRLAKKIASVFSYQPTIKKNGQKKWWPCLFEGENTKHGFVWALKNEIKEWFLSSYSEREFYKNVKASFNGNRQERQQRLLSAEKKPRRIEKRVWDFVRNPDVVAEVLYLANGKCQECKSNAPFLRKSDGAPYLEVHHKIPLSQGGEDTVKNSIALCPNCHRRKHFG